MLFNFEGTSKRDLEKKKYGGLAQLGEHLLCKQGVKGSIPLISTSRDGDTDSEIGWSEKEELPRTMRNISRKVSCGLIAQLVRALG